MSRNRRKALKKVRKAKRLFPIIDRQSYEAAIELLEDAVDLVKDMPEADRKKFPEPYAWLAYALMTGWVDDWITGDDQADKVAKRQQAVAHAREKLKEVGVEFLPESSKPPIDRLPDVPVAVRNYDVLWAAGFVSLHGETGHKADRAVQYFDAAILANGTNPALAVEAADAYVYAGKPDEAIELVRDGMEETAHPDWYAWVLAWAYYFKARRAATNEEKKALYRIGIEHLEDAQPGRGGSPLDILLTRAALNAQLKALLENSTDPEEMAEKRAAGKEYNRATRRYNEWRSSDPARSSLTEDIVTATNPFSDDGDLGHWIEGLAKAEIIY